MEKYLHVAVGVIENGRGEILIAKRPDSVHQGGLWEFPGGKVEVGETIQSALSRELKEELAIQVERSQPLIQIRHDYSDKSVLLDVRRVTRFSGVALGNEGQPIAWVKPEHLSQYQFPSANKPIITAISLPSVCAITGDYSSYHDFAEKFSSLIKQDLKMIQLRINHFSYQEHVDFLNVANKCCADKIQLQLNTSVDEFMKISQPNQKIGLHLNSYQLMQQSARPIHQDLLLGASCHSLEELKQAEKIRADYVFLSPVQPTQSHPEKIALGWIKCEELIKSINIPIYLLGGMQIESLSQAIEVGAQGIAGIGSWWK